MANVSREQAWSRVTIWGTATLLVLCVGTYIVQLADGTIRSPGPIIQLALAIPLIYGNIVYQLSRIGALRREGLHQAPTRAELEKIYDYDRPPPRLAILIPSYREEPAIIAQTLLSAALMEFPGRRIVVLIDDPPTDHSAREASWGAIKSVKQMLAGAAEGMREELTFYKARLQSAPLDVAAERDLVARLYEQVADLLDSWAVEFAAAWRSSNQHSVRFFIDQVLKTPARRHRERAGELRVVDIDAARITHELTRLSALFCDDIDGFERKLFDNLPHAPNKAMNLNAYLGLMGRTLSVGNAPNRILRDVHPADADLVTPDADFVLTLDADSLVLSDYALKLITVMIENPSVAVAQTPYSAFPDAPSSLERTAGATTDIQYVAHQGATYFGATYWVGANALLRVAALRDIKCDVTERSYVVPMFIQDRTVIEDTGSTVDLIRCGWTLYNFPERLAYSATPPDFGALTIQRQRWSNGGLVILPDLLEFCRSQAPCAKTSLEAFLRIHYLVSPSVGSASMLALLIYPFEPILAAMWLPLISLPYYFLYGRDLIRAGYRWIDLLRVYALNLLLLPVCLAGVMLSIRQILTSRKASFGRTPKVEHRTMVPPSYFIFNALMFSAMIGSIIYALWTKDWGRGLFPAFNALFYTYGLTRMIGLRNGITDALTVSGLFGREQYRLQPTKPAMLDRLPTPVD